MKAMMAGLFEAYGQEVVRQETGRRWMAYVQPVRRENKETDIAVTELGDVDHRLWRYIGPADLVLWEGAELLTGGEAFRVRERSRVMLGMDPLYERALMEKAKEEAQ